jgi:predicted RecA/RadA family phage recombinase
MKNFIQRGDTLTLIAPAGGVVGGNTYLIGALVVVALATAAAGAEFSAARLGCFELAKVAAQAWTPGQPAYWDNAAGLWTNVGGAGVTRAGTIIAAAANPTATGQVCLSGNAAPLGA